ncbi:hypothetical protein NDU88_003688 [Pleurodeles waltl]|uniref:Uncharacterized protein n=1 Tax=Pleurodeles waltl TaxID=8319 RepID=A0AAV7NK06_PLEWA|nr:hypothetical protein NDU88_003688 [Pleurodeles waltl]
MWPAAVSIPAWQHCCEQSHVRLDGGQRCSLQWQRGNGVVGIAPCLSVGVLPCTRDRQCGMLVEVRLRTRMIEPHWTSVGKEESDRPCVATLRGSVSVCPHECD